MLQTAPALLALFLGAAPAAPATGPAPALVLQDTKVPLVEEKESDHEYPAWVDSTLKKDAAEGAKSVPLDLTGLGIREKTIFNVNVYSYVLYVDRGYIQKDLASYKGKKSKVIEKDKALFQKLLSQNTTKELRMRFCRNVDADDVVEAFDDSMKPRILKLKEKVKGTEAEKLKTLKTFRGFFSLDKLKKNMELRFTWHPDGTMSTVVNGERKPDITDPDLAKALFDVYLGEKPISKSGKKKLVRRLPGLLEKAK